MKSEGTSVQAVNLLNVTISCYYKLDVFCEINIDFVFNILLPVHLAIFLADNQLDAPLLIDLFILFFNSLHVSGTMCPSSGETKLC
jgi:hypothetical protein